MYSLLSIFLSLLLSSSSSSSPLTSSSSLTSSFLLLRAPCSHHGNGPICAGRPRPAAPSADYETTPQEPRGFAAKVRNTPTKTKRKKNKERKKERRTRKEGRRCAHGRCCTHQGESGYAVPCGALWREVASAVNFVQKRSHGPALRKETSCSEPGEKAVDAAWLPPQRPLTGHVRSIILLAFAFLSLFNAFC